MRKIALALLLLSVLSSCRLIRPSMMLKTPKGYVYDKLSDSASVSTAYLIAPDDQVQIRLLANEGFRMVDVSDKQFTSTSQLDVTVEPDGHVKLPLIGRIKLQGLTMQETEQMLETRFSEFYVGAYVLAKVTNKRVTVFPGQGATARVINLGNNNTTVFEALALAAGIPEDGMAYKIKLIRNTPPKPKVFLIDLSTIDGLKDGNTIVQANDIIYVQSRDRIARRLTTEIVPYVSLLTSVLLLYSIFTR